MARFSLDYSPVPAVNPSGGTGARENIPTNPNMFGGAIAQAEQGLGSAMERAAVTGIGLASDQAQIDAQTHAAEVHSWQSEQTTKAQEEFLSLRGRAALDAQPAFDKRIREINDEAISKAGNPYAQRLITEQGRRMVDVTSSSFARHSASQRKEWENRTAVNSAQSYGNRAVLLATSSGAAAVNEDEPTQSALLNSDNEVRNLFHGQGYDEPAIEAEVQKNRGKNVKAIVEQIAGADGSADNPSPGNIKRAFDFFKAQEEKIDAGSRVAISNYLRGPLNQIAGGRIADEAMGRPPVAQAPEVVADVPANFVAAVKAEEGYRAKPYWDVKQWSVGFGTRASGPDDVVDEKEANRRFNQRFTEAAKFVDSVNPNLDAGTRAAMSALTYNAGQAWAGAGLGDAIRAGDLAKAKELFLQYNKAGGERNEVLVMRRAREAAWFGRGDITPAEAGQPRRNKGAVMLQILDNPDLQNRPQVQAAALARVSKIYQAFELQRSQDQASFDVSVKNATAEALSTGHVTKPLSHEQFISAYGPTDGEKQWAEYQANVQFGADVRTTAGLSPADLAALREKYVPQPGESFIAMQKRQALLDKAIASNEKMKADDPADFLIRRTEFGSEAYKQFQAQMVDKAATPEMKTTYAGMYAEKMRAEQLRLGIAADKVQVVPNFYVEQLAAKLNNPAQNGGTLAVAQGIEAEAKLWGSHWPEVYRQLADKAQPVVRVIGSGVKPEAAQMLADLAPFSLAAILKDQDTEKNATIKKDVLDAFKPLAGSMGGQDGAISVFNDFREQAEKLAARYVIGGMTSKDAATKAYDDLVGFKYVFPEQTYRVPKDPNINPDQVMQGAAAVKAAIGKRQDKSLAVNPARDVLGGLNPEYLERGKAESVARDGKWVTSPDEKGLMLTYGDRAVRMKDGKPLVVPWRELQDYATRAREGFKQDLAITGIAP
jgi:GH24 family phage-related lysozyme (muramidase)